MSRVELVLTADGAVRISKNGRLVSTLLPGEDADIYDAVKIEVRHGS